jgi:hypothetical protein
MRCVIRKLKITFLLALAPATWAQSSPELILTQANSSKTLWMNAGFYSHHFDPDLNLRDHNLGFGLEYRYRPN